MAKRLIRKQALDEFGKVWVETLRNELLNNKPFPKRASGRLVNSINYKVIQTPNGDELRLFAENYLTFVDKGVSGTEKKYATPYSYRTKYPPIQTIRYIEYRSKWKTKFEGQIAEDILAEIKLRFNQ